jgi:putative Mn2+ efflux pump MntP
LSFIETLFIAISLSIDSFTVSLATGTTGQNLGRRAVLRLSFHLALFQAGLPILGWWLGSIIEPIIAPYDHWVAFLLLLFVAFRMLKSENDKSMNEGLNDPTHGWMLVILSTATSIDALAVGLGLAMLNVSIWFPSLVIFTITMLASLAGVKIGSQLEGKFGRKLHYLGAAILILIGVRIVASHLNS